MADKWLTFDCYGTVADWNAGMSGALAAIGGRPDASRLLAAYHQAELELEAGPGWRPYREVLTAGLARAAGREHIALPPRRRGRVRPGLAADAGIRRCRPRPDRAGRTAAGGWRS